LQKRIFAIIAALMVFAAPARAENNVIVVFDASNSMWGQIGGVAKIEIARDVLGGLISGWDRDINIGLVAYGHRSNECTDIETLIPPGPLDAGEFIRQVQGLVPRGRTPLTAAVEHAAEALSYRDSPGTVILISDGVESCDRDPCLIADTLARSGLNFTAHVIGFGLGADEDRETLACIAEATGGVFVAADDAGQLTAALEQIKATVEVAAPPPVVNAPPEIEIVAAEVTLSVPATAVAGSTFPVTWSPTIDGRDYITIVPVGAATGTLANQFRAGVASPGTLQAPADPGLYEVRYVLNEGRRTLGMAEIEIVAAEVTLSVPATAVAGSTFPVTWSPTIDGRDYITIVPVGAATGTLANQFRAGVASPGTLQAPADPGLYEVRYVLNEGRRTLGMAEIEIVAAEVTLSVPATAVAGSTFPVTWSPTIDGRDYITIVPVGAATGTLANQFRAGVASPGTLRAPADPGLYEVRYVLNEGRRTLGMAEIEIVAAEVTLSVPATAVAGSTFPVIWSPTIDGRDYITIVPVGAATGTLANQFRAGVASPGTLQAPADPGLYEVRYVLNEGRRTLGMAEIEIVAAEAAEAQILDVPSVVQRGATITVTWKAPGPVADTRLALARSQQGDFTWLTVQDAPSGMPLTFTAPLEVGFFEFRLVDMARRHVLARFQFEVR